MDHVVITGGSRGIGLGLTHIALEAGHHVAVFSRHPKESKELKKLQETYPERLEIHSFDVSSESAGTEIKKALQHWQKIDLLFNNAGTYKKEDDQKNFVESFKVNSIAPYLIYQSLLPLLKKSSSPKVINTSSLMGSITENTSGASHVYRSSKSALNMIVKGLSLEHPEVTSVVIHPGWVKTEMGGENAPVEVKDSAAGIWKLQQGLKKSDSGRFFNYNGKELPW